MHIALHVCCVCSMQCSEQELSKSVNFPNALAGFYVMSFALCRSHTRGKPRQISRV